MEWFIWLVFGHLFGDYMFQNIWMALNKKSNHLACLVHCTIYTLIVSVFLTFGNIDLFEHYFIIPLIFLSHIILDGTRLVDYWIHFYDIRSWSTFLPGGKHYIKGKEDTINAVQAVQTSFGALVYVAIDNTLHLFMMFLIIKYLGV